jgi:phosphoribosylformylglycinamidine cyclo-ligase
MEKSYSASYAAAGVDITAGYRSVELMKQYVARTMNEHCIGGLGGFGGLFELDCTDMPHPVLISGTDGVGTKLRIAQYLNRHDTVGIDCVAMCVNDVICAGAKPLVFLDYIACGKNVPERIADIVKGVAEGCVQAGASLVGGETAEMPGFYPENEYDLAGFTVGAVDKSKILDNSTMAPGDAVLALPSSGVHSNGFSLVRKILDLEKHPGVLDTMPAELGGKTLGEALLAPTKIYVKPVLAVMERVTVKGVSHITGGGFYENIPRSIKAGCCARIARADVKTPPLFGLLQKLGKIPERDMFNTFNMGVGMVLTVAEKDAEEALAILHAAGEPEAYRLGVIAAGEGVELC